MSIEKAVLKYIPLLAPVPTAWMVGDASVTLLHFPVPVAISAACMVEGVGFAAINMVIRMREFNRHLDAVDSANKMHAPTWQAMIVAALYIIVVSLMEVVLHIIPALIVYSPLAFIGMVAAGGWLFGLSQDQDAREEKYSKRREEIKKEKERKKSERTAANSPKGATKSVASAKSAAGSASKYPHKCEFCDEQLRTPNAVGGHMKKNHPDKCKKKSVTFFVKEEEKVEK